MPDRPTVVVIDDEEGQLVVMDAILSDDYHVVCFQSGQEAIRALDQWPNAIVLCDQRMPGMTGDEVLTRIRILYPNTVRVLVTWYVDTPAIVRALNDGNIFAYFQKPFEASDLRLTVERARRSQEVRLENARLQDELMDLRNRMEAMIHERTTALEDENRTLRDLAESDGLTGLFNSRSLQMRLRDEQERLLRYGQQVALVMADVDDFKKVNDTFGHQAGDAVLKAVADAIRRTARQGDFVARYGGEEFVIIAPASGEEGATLLAERVRQAVAAEKVEVAPGKVVSVTISLGVAACDRTDGPTLQEALRRSDEAMYRVKRSGKNGVVTWTQLRHMLSTRPQSVFVRRPASKDTPVN